MQIYIDNNLSTNHFEVNNTAAMVMVEFRDNSFSYVKHFAYIFLIIRNSCNIYNANFYFWWEKSVSAEYKQISWPFCGIAKLFSWTRLPSFTKGHKEAVIYIKMYQIYLNSQTHTHIYIHSYFYIFGAYKIIYNMILIHLI